MRGRRAAGDGVLRRDRRRHSTLPLAPRGHAVPAGRLERALPDSASASARATPTIARRIGRPAAVRAVGAANGANPIAVVIPCHRVVGSDGIADRLRLGAADQELAARPRVGIRRLPFPPGPEACRVRAASPQQRRLRPTSGRRSLRTPSPSSSASAASRVLARREGADLDARKARCRARGTRASGRPADLLRVPRRARRVGERADLDRPRGRARSGAASAAGPIDDDLDAHRRDTGADHAEPLRRLLREVEDAALQRTARGR